MTTLTLSVLCLSLTALLLALYRHNRRLYRRLALASASLTTNYKIVSPQTSEPRALATLEAWLSQNSDYILFIDSPGPERPGWRCEIAHEFSDSVFGYGETMMTALSDAFLRFNSEAEALRRTWNAKRDSRSL